MLKKFKIISSIIFILGIIILIILSIILSIKGYKNLNPNIEIGDIIVKEYYLDDPYKEVKRDTLDIIDEKGDYVLYIKRSTGDTLSDMKYWVNKLSRKINYD